MRDVYVEWLVSQKDNTGFKVLKILSLVLAILCGALFFIYFNIFLLLGTIGFAVLTYFTGLYICVEYEYTFVGGELTIDRILAKSKRKRMDILDLSKAEIIAPLGSSKLDGFSYKNYREYDYTSKERNQDSHIFVLYYQEGKKLLLEPSRELVEAFRSQIPHKVHMEM